MFSFLGFGSSDLTELRSKASIEKDPIKQAEIQKDITCAEAEEKLELVKKSIKERGAQGNNMGSSSMGMSNTGMGMGNNNTNRDINGRFQSSAANGISSMFGGRRRRSHRRR